jgi:DNA-binding transcriptional LysR family regulator
MYYILIMELRQLKYFVAVAEELHFGRAARRVHISQPPLSQQIKALEDEMGVRLFERTSRSVSLTAAGRLFLEEARSILVRMDRAAGKAVRAARGEIGPLSIGFVGPVMDSRLPGALREFRKKFPDVSLSLHEQGTRAQLEALNQDRIHLGFLRLFGNDLPGFRRELFLRESYLLALPRGHTLAQRRDLTLASLKGQPMIFFPRSIQPALYDHIKDALKHSGVNPLISQEAGTKHTTTALVSAGLGVALVPASTANIRRAGVTYRSIKGDLPPVEIFMVWPEDTDNPILDHFLQIARSYKTGDFS